MSELKRLAYVEDDPDIRAIAELALVDVGGFDLTMFASGQEAVAGMSAARPELILMDVMMPKMGGVEATEAIRALDKKWASSMPVIALTADY